MQLIASLCWRNLAAPHMTVSNITKSNTKWPPYGFITIGKVNTLSRKFFTASLSYRVWVFKDNMLIYLPTLSTLEKDEENGALIVERNASLLHSSENSASVVSQESRYGWLNRLCSAEPLEEQEIQSQRSKVNSIQPNPNTHIHIFGYIFW